MNVIALVYVGRNDSNVGKHSSKGYILEQDGKRVTVYWGPIESKSEWGRAPRFYWTYSPQQVLQKFATPALAVNWMREQAERKIDEGYERTHHRIKMFEVASN